MVSFCCLVFVSFLALGLVVIGAGLIDAAPRHSGRARAAAAAAGALCLSAGVGILTLTAVALA